MDGELIGLFEIASLANVTPSAVANWRKRFSTDFPAPIADLKSGPVFRGGEIRAWLAKRQTKDLQLASQYYDQMATKRGDDPELMAKVEETVNYLCDGSTSVRSPGMLLGKIQSGKTRAFLGIIARCFDRGYGVAVVLTKNNVSLTQQTLTRIKEDFRELIAAEEVLAEDVMSLPHLEAYELNKRLILVVKKEDDNLHRLLDVFERRHPELRQKKVLIIDDEADYASVSAQRKDGVIGVGKISRQIDHLRGLVADSDFLQVTATPYSLYLQPEEEMLVGGIPLFKPKRPKFTVILPTHSYYVGGDFYFERSMDPDSPAYYFYREVPLEEREALKKEDRRRLRIENVLGGESRGGASGRDRHFHCRWRHPSSAGEGGRATAREVQLPLPHRASARIPCMAGEGRDGDQNGADRGSKDRHTAVQRAASQCLHGPATIDQVGRLVLADLRRRQGGDSERANRGRTHDYESQLRQSCQGTARGRWPAQAAHSAEHVHRRTDSGPRASPSTI